MVRPYPTDTEFVKNQEQAVVVEETAVLVCASISGQNKRKIKSKEQVVLTLGIPLPKKQITEKPCSSFDINCKRLNLSQHLLYDCTMIVSLLSASL